MKRPLVSMQSLMFAVITLWLLGFLPALFFEKPDKAGEFGDMFGAVNALFSALAFAGVLYAIFLQQIALEIQREDSKKAAGASRRQLHIEIQRMSMEDPDLQAVWGYRDLSTDRLRKQHAYINLVLSNWENDFVNGELNEAKLKVVIGRYIREPLFSHFWSRTRQYRADGAKAGGDPKSIRFHKLVDDLYLSRQGSADA